MDRMNIELERNMGLAMAAAAGGGSDFTSGTAERQLLNMEKDFSRRRYGATNMINQRTSNFEQEGRNLRYQSAVSSELADRINPGVTLGTSLLGSASQAGTSYYMLGGEFPDFSKTKVTNKTPRGNSNYIGAT